MRAGSWINGILFGSVGVCLLWAAGGLWFVYGWLPSYVEGDVVEIPDFRMRSASATRELAMRAGIRINFETTEERFDPNVPRGHVISHVPTRRQRVKRTRPVRFTLSLGPEVVEIPELAGRTVREAHFELTVRGLRMDTEVATYTDDTVLHAIVASSPARGAAVPRGTAVSVLVSLGPRPRRLAMPRLVGLSITEAEATLERYGFTLCGVKYVIDSRAAPQVVLAQDPMAETTVRTGDRVSVSVNRRGISQRGDTRLVIVDHAVGGAPEDEVHVKIVLVDEKGRDVLVNTYEPGGTHISRPWTAIGSARLIVYENNMRSPIREEQLP